MESTCILTGKKFIISGRKLAYLSERGLPLPEVHPQETLKWIESFRNRIYLYNSTCAFSGKSILSCFPPEQNLTIYDSAYWSSDQWDATSYGVDYNFNRSFFDQFEELLHRVPLPNRTVTESNIENSPYVNGAVNLKNCHLAFITLDSQDCMFCWNVFNSNQVIDSVYCYHCELVYGGIDLDHCYNVLFAESSIHCSDSAFLFNCQSCKYCFGCVNLNNKEYCWYNEQLTKEEFVIRRAQLNLGSQKALEQEKENFAKFRRNFPIKYYRGKSNEECSGDYLLNNKNCTNSYLTSGSIDCEDCVIALSDKDCFCVSSSKSAELCYNSQTGPNYNNQFCNECISTKNLQFCMYCMTDTSDCFGSISLQKKQYCILNKQYTKDEYFSLIEKIKKHMIANGEYQDYFSKKISPFYYNHSDAMTFFPLNKEEALSQGFRWQDDTIDNFTPSYQLPDDINNTSDEVLDHTLKCTQTGKRYRIIKQELEYCRKMKVALPRIAPIERIIAYSQLFAIKPLSKRPCGKCKAIVQTVYVDNDQLVLCEECYLQAAY